MSKVGITRVKCVDDQDEIKNAFRVLLASMQHEMNIPPRSTVLIKVNLCYIKGPETGVTVDPRLTKCYVEWLLENFDIKEVIIAEADATHLSADIAFKVLGWDQIFAPLPKTRLLNLSQDKVLAVSVKGLHFKRIEMSKTYMEANYLVSFAKLKTHTTELITGAMKNLFGALPEKVKCVYHPYLADVIYDLTKVRPPDFCVVDGIIAHEGMGPVHGMPKPMGLILVSDDAVATDHACARLMGRNPRRVPHLKAAMQNGLGSKEYTVMGCQIDEVKENFAFLPKWRQMYFALKERRSKSQ